MWRSYAWYNITSCGEIGADLTVHCACEYSGDRIFFQFITCEDMAQESERYVRTKVIDLFKELLYMYIWQKNQDLSIFIVT